MILIRSSVKCDLFNICLASFFSNSSTRAFPISRLNPRQSFPRQVDKLCINVFVRFSRYQSQSFHIYLEAVPPALPPFPAFLINFSPSYLNPLCLYTTAGLKDLIFAAISPPLVLSAPRTVILFSFTSNTTPSPASTTTGCEYPKARLNCLPVVAALEPAPASSRV